ARRHFSPSLPAPAPAPHRPRRVAPPRRPGDRRSGPAPGGARGGAGAALEPLRAPPRGLSPARTPMTVPRARTARGEACSKFSSGAQQGAAGHLHRGCETASNPAQGAPMQSDASTRLTLPRWSALLALVPAACGGSTQEAAPPPESPARAAVVEELAPLEP